MQFCNKVSKNYIENFDNITSDNKILSDIDTNPLSTPRTDRINQNTKSKIDSLMAEIKIKQSTINTLSKKINNEAIETVKNINNDQNISGKNIFFTTIPYTNIYNNLTPICVMTKNQVLETGIIEDKKNTEPPLNAPANDWGFKSSLYELSHMVKENNKDIYIGIPLRPTGDREPILSNVVKNAAMNTFTDKIPNNNHSFYYSIHNAPWEPEKNSSNKTINDFNLSYINLLPGNLMNSNFLSVGYNGYIYIGTGVEENELEKSNQTGENFLNYLIKNHNLTLNGSGKYIVNGTPTARCVPGTKICGNLNTGTNYREQAKQDVNRANAIFSAGAAFGGSNPGLQSDFDSYGVSRLRDSEIADVENKEHPLSGFPWLSLLSSDGNNIVGPNLNDWASERGGNVSNPTKQAFLVGGLKSYTYSGCWKDYPPPNRIIEKYVGNKSLDDCISYANKNTYNLIGMQFGEGVAPDNFTNGQCWVTKKTLNELKREKGIDCSSGLCLDSQNCHGNPPIGSSLVNAIYKNNNAPMRLGAELYIQGFEGSLSSNAIPGSLVYKYPDNEGNLQIEIIWKPNTLIYKDILIPFPTTQNTKLHTKITNSGSNLQYIFGTEGIALYSSDFYFKLVLDSFVDKSGQPKTGFMNSSNAFNFMPSIKLTPLMKIINYNNTGIKVNLNTDLSRYDIKSKDKRINHLFQLINSVDPGSTFSQGMGNFTIIYKLNSLNNDLLGETGYINYNKKKNSSDNIYNLSLYSKSQSQKSFKNEEAKFVNTKGTINKNLFPNNTIAPFNNEIENNISLTKVNSESECKRICYNNLDECQAWELDEKNCWTYKSKTNDIKKLLQVQAPITLFNPWASNDKLNIRVPNIQNNKTCPNTIKDTIINAETPTLSNNIKNSNISWNGFKSDLYWRPGSAMDINNYCNVKKIINTDEIKLKKLQDELLVLLNHFDSLMQGLEKKEQNIYKKLINQEIITNKATNKFENIKKKVNEESNNLDTQRTLDQSINDSLFNLINTNYNLIIWTVLAITIIVSAIHFSRNIKIKK